MPASPPLLPLALFGLTYLGLALGHVPPFRLDRTGFALLGAVAFLATGAITVAEAKEAVDAPTLALLFGMMILSAQYRLSGLYGAIGRRLAGIADERCLLAGIIVAGAGLAAVLTNDVVCFALAPLLGSVLLASGRDPLPHLIALACATNLGSALTPIGNPQNILIAQRLALPFIPFVLACALPVVASLGVLYLLLARRLRRSPLGALAAPIPLPLDEPLDHRQAIKAIVLTLAAIVLFLSPVPLPLTALAIAGVVLTSRRMQTRDMLALVDWQLLALFVGLFVVVRGFELSGWTAWVGHRVIQAGADLTHPAVLVPVVAVLSNLVGNVPAVMLLLPFVGQGARVGHALALASTFAGNAILIGSIANLIVAEQASRLGIRFGFREHARIGLPVTLAALAFAVLALLAG
ncbi:MAG TPA: SLC13 family permease [Thermoanaerobaculia bacterium]|jgi:Na+/H+ antiporter NhaD/arsenite permease-like protein|nr:SLC13 family permease [Thermoanaerobaculia bacterium]